MKQATSVTTSAELMAALAAGNTDIRIRGTVRSTEMVTLPPGVSLRGGALEGGGLRLTRDNTVADIAITVPDSATAITNDGAEPDLGTLTLRGVRTRGRVHLRADGMTRAGHIDIDGLYVESANLGVRARHPAGGGGPRQGAITVVNRQLDPDAALTARLCGLRVGNSRTPVQGCGVVVGGRYDGDGDGGKIWIDELSVDEVHIGGASPAPCGAVVEVGVLVQPGGYVGDLVITGPLVCYGTRQVGLCNLGAITRCVAMRSITASGREAVGIRNIGRIGTLALLGPLVTYGRDGHGADLRGNIARAALRSVTTFGAGAIGVRVSNSIGRLHIAEDLCTYGDRESPADAPATGLRIQRGGRVRNLDVRGRIASHGTASPAVEIGGELGPARVAGGVFAFGAGADAVCVQGVRVLDLDDVAITAHRGRELRLVPVPRRPPSVPHVNHIAG
ncbi:hypothetical protein ACFVUS_09415 [Nocardia sp. NPDC058058]|uniref:hypothetical protein n=1 Tax=Nocardia sp. NPDC058058 TaxID=3346317 RepID=UPI0036DE6990